MRIVEREVTVKKTVYIADDGREFVCEDDCLDHEFDIMVKFLDGYCYDKDFNKTSAEDCAFAYLPNGELVEIFVKACDVYGVVADGVDKPGIYMYSDFANTWINLDDVTARFKEALNAKDGADYE